MKMFPILISTFYIEKFFFFFLKTCEQNLQQAIIVLTDHSLFIGYICQENLFNFYIYFQ